MTQPEHSNDSRGGATTTAAIPFSEPERSDTRLAQLAYILNDQSGLSQLELTVMVELIRQPVTAHGMSFADLRLRPQLAGYSASSIIDAIDELVAEGFLSYFENAEGEPAVLLGPEFIAWDETGMVA